MRLNVCIFPSAFKEGQWWKKCLLIEREKKKGLELPFRNQNSGRVNTYPLSCLGESGTVSTVTVCINFHKSFSGSPENSKKTQANNGLNFILLTQGR